MARESVPEGVTGYNQTVTNEYGNPFTLHINKDSGGTVHKHSGEPGEDNICPFCNDDVDYGHGITYEGPSFPSN